MSAAEGASEASSPEQANEWAVRANERTDERVAQYLRLDSCLFQTIVRRFYVFTQSFINFRLSRSPPSVIKYESKSIIIEYSSIFNKACFSNIFFGEDPPAPKSTAAAPKKVEVAPLLSAGGVATSAVQAAVKTADSATNTEAYDESGKDKLVLEYTDRQSNRA